MEKVVMIKPIPPVVRSKLKAKDDSCVAQWNPGLCLWEGSGLLCLTVLGRILVHQAHQAAGTNAGRLIETI